MPVTAHVHKSSTARADHSAGSERTHRSVPVRQNRPGIRVAVERISPVPGSIQKRSKQPAPLSASLPLSWTPPHHHQHWGGDLPPFPVLRPALSGSVSETTSGVLQATGLCRGAGARRAARTLSRPHGIRRAGAPCSRRLIASCSRQDTRPWPGAPSINSIKSIHCESVNHCFGFHVSSE